MNQKKLHWFDRLLSNKPFNSKNLNITIMKFKGLLLFFFFSLTLLASCGDKNKTVKENAAEQLKIEIEKLAEAMKKTGDSLQQVEKERIRKDSITQDSLSQVKEHGHAH
ncbi:MAG TPA: hypothetical protein VKA10_06775 [Prolixibacteraceae bacterium]|nr:hypothetical protein [Prolixibacteraceae bacterium]